MRKSNPTSFKRSGVWCVDAIHGAIQPLGGFPDARSIASRNLLQESPLVSFPHAAMTLRVGAAMPNEFIAARFQCVDDTGAYANETSQHSAPPLAPPIGTTRRPK